MYKRKNRDERGYIADYLNNFERRKRFMNKVKFSIILALLTSYIYLLYDKVDREVSELSIENQVNEVPCYINVQMAKDSLHMHYGKIIDSISTYRKKRY